MQIINTWNFCEPFLLFNYFVLFGHHEYRNGGTILYAAVCVPCYQTKCKAAILKVFAVLKKVEKATNSGRLLTLAYFS